MMKRLLTTMAILEALAGISLIAAPSLFAAKLLGTASLDDAASTITRITGAALTTLGIFCWLFRHSDQARRVVTAMLFYNLSVAAILLHAKLVLNVNGTALVPAIVLHSIIGAGCLFTLRKKD